MKLIDRYFIRQFIQTLLFGLLAFTVIFVIVDMMENLDDFIDQKVPQLVIFEYYLYFIPEIVRLMTPVASLLSCLFAVGKMATQNELTAIKSSGVSLYRIMAPFLIAAFAISLFSVYFGGYVVPMANKSKVAIEKNYMKKGLEAEGSNIFFQDSDTRIVSIYTYDQSRYQANRVSIQEFDRKDLTKMTSRIDATMIQYDTLKRTWTAFNGIRRTFSGESETAERFVSQPLKNVNFRPEEILTKRQKPEEMTLGDLKKFYEEQARTGNNPTRWMIEYHSRYAFAMASFIVVFLGLPMAASKKRGGLALQFGISLMFTFLYLGFMKISEAFGKNGVLDPLITAWIANIIFFIGALINLFRVQK